MTLDSVSEMTLGATSSSLNYSTPSCHRRAASLKKLLQLILQELAGFQKQHYINMNYQNGQILQYHAGFHEDHTYITPYC